MISPANYLALKRHWLLTALCLLTACQSTTTVVDAPLENNWSRDVNNFMQAHEVAYQTHENLNDWRYSAKVGITTSEAREQANLVWQFADQANQVRLFGPLGVGAIKIDFDQYGVVLSDSRRELHRGDSAEALMKEIVGWPIPIDALSYWLFALPLPDKAFEYQDNDSGELHKLRQLGWEIEYTGYKQYVLNDSQRPVDEQYQELLPSKIIASKPDENGGLVVVKLITKGWR